MFRSERRLQYLISAAVATQALNVGVSFSWACPQIAKFHDKETGFEMNEQAVSWMVSVSSFGYIIGSVITNFTTDTLGRRWTIIGSGIPGIIGCILIILARDSWLLGTGRFLWGGSSGIIATVMLTYLTEIADKDIRGFLSLMTRVAHGLGCLITLAGGSLVSYNTINYATLSLPIVNVISCWWIPESPYLLIRKGKVEKAREIIRKLNRIRDDGVLEDKLTQIKEDVKRETLKSGSIKELFTGKQYRRAVIILIGVTTARVLSGLLTIMFYLGPITHAAKSGIHVTTVTIVFGVIRSVLSFLSSMLVDRWGRRPLMMFSLIGTTFSLAITGTYFFVQNPDISYDPYGVIPIIGVMAVALFCVLGIESVGYLIPAEIFPLNVKSVAMSFNNIYGGLLAFVSVKSYQNIKDVADIYGVFWTFAGICFLGAIFTYYCVLETKGKSLREIQIELQGVHYVDEKSVLENGTEMKVLNADRKH